MESKISITEAMLIMMYVGATDAIGVFLALVGLDDFGILDVATFPVTQLYFRMKGVKSSYDLVGSVLEIIPYLGDLPIKTVGVAITIWADWHQATASELQGTAALRQKLMLSQSPQAQLTSNATIEPISEDISKAA